MSIVGDGPKLVIDFENYRPGQDSVSKDEVESKLNWFLIVHKKLNNIIQNRQK